MAATIQIHEMTALATGYDKTSGTVRFRNVNATGASIDDPLIVPSSGYDYSFTKNLRLYMAGAPTTQVINLRMYTDGSLGYGTGMTVYAKNDGVSFVSPYHTAMAGGTDFFTYTSGSPMDMDATDTGPFLPADQGSYIGDLLELQCWCASTASSGVKTAEVITFAWDDV